MGVCAPACVCDLLLPEINRTLSAVKEERKRKDTKLSCKLHQHPLFAATAIFLQKIMFPHLAESYEQHQTGNDDTDVAGQLYEAEGKHV